MVKSAEPTSMPSSRDDVQTSALSFSDLKSSSIRIQMEDDFKSEKLKALVCTSSLELGIDVGSADFTIQFDSPRQVTRLIQRVGRSGHRISEVSLGAIVTTEPRETAESIV